LGFVAEDNVKACCSAVGRNCPSREIQKGVLVLLPCYPRHSRHPAAD
jgi:hypothetical protein